MLQVGLSTTSSALNSPCIGSFISKRLILLAAHCVNSEAPDTMKHVSSIILTKTTAAQNEVALSYHLSYS